MKQASPTAALVRVGLAATLAVATWAIYGQTFDFGFVHLDDPRYVWRNPYLANGLTAEFFRFAWGFSPEAIYQGVSNWHPFTWLSYGLDVSLFGVDAGAMHRTNTLLHLLNGGLIFALFDRTTRAAAASALVAALFLVHPLHVEAVAWVSERKEVLSTLFALGACHAWVSHTRREHGGVSLAALALHAASLLAKPMWVTLPFLLLLLDVWPLARDAVPIRRRLVEKLPFVAVSLASGLVTLYAQRGAIGAAEAIPLGARLANALLAPVEYLRLTLWPRSLSILYPHPFVDGGTPPGVLDWIGVLAVIAVLAALAWHTRGDRVIAVGLGWFVIALAPVVGILQVGDQAIADRYTYVSLIGVFAALAFAPRAWLAARPTAVRHATTVAVLVVLALLSIRAHDQASVWRDSVSLYVSAREATPNSARVRFNLGNRLRDVGREAEAADEYAAAARLRPAWAAPRTNHAWLLATTPDADLVDGARAVALATEALDRAPADANTLDTLAAAYAAAGDFPRAIDTARRAVAQARADGHPGRARSYDRRRRLFVRGQRWVEPRGADDGGRSSSSPAST